MSFAVKPDSFSAAWINGTVYAHDRGRPAQALRRRSQRAFHLTIQLVG